MCRNMYNVKGINRGPFYGTNIEISRKYWSWCVLCYKSVVRWFDPNLEFFIDIKSFRSHYGSEVDSAPNRNEYQDHFLGVKAAGA